ncbi:MAG: NfeD family protein [Pirellulales bacterium]|nr:NfeD family protein [Pirellulales bacterium]
MTTIFLICATLGGGVLVIQFVLSLVGFGADALDLDVPGDMHADVNTDVDLGTDFHGATDFHDGTDFQGDADIHDSGLPADAHHIDSSWLFTVISVRTVVAALAFFGLAGLAADSADIAPPLTLAIAVAAGLVAMFTVYWIMRGLMGLRAEGTAHIANAVGRVGTVYTTIPGEGSGVGKIQLSLQGRTMEYLALTPGEGLKPGAKVVVGAVISADTLEVEPALEETSDP